MKNKKCFNEVYDIINHLEKNLYDKIPKKFIEFVENNIDKNLKVNIDYSITINEQYLEPDTRAILALVYRDYLCDDEERKKLIEKEKEDILLEEKDQGDYIFNDLFNKDKTSNVTSESEEVALVEYKESLWGKFKKLMQRLLNN